ncbi:hypothetical protein CAUPRSCDRAFT_10917 [Caulochytrium protostelioides]|uniref:Uncharacterized protein n=1 Tax=Caulochytrium protostelioides TaxID=1555241 RepID=A0A4V1ITK8_9FUNG|nr:hypothetical protein CAUPRSCDRAFT_10917 [Caulochytrium protostelioides]
MPEHGQHGRWSPRWYGECRCDLGSARERCCDPYMLRMPHVPLATVVPTVASAPTDALVSAMVVADSIEAAVPTELPQPITIYHMPNTPSPSGRCLSAPHDIAQTRKSGKSVVTPNPPLDGGPCDGGPDVGEPLAQAPEMACRTEHAAAGPGRTTTA